TAQSCEWRRFSCQLPRSCWRTHRTRIKPAAMNSTIKGIGQNEYPNRPQSQKNTATSSSAKKSERRFLRRLTRITSSASLANHGEEVALHLHWRREIGSRDGVAGRPRMLVGKHPDPAGVHGPLPGA